MAHKRKKAGVATPRRKKAQAAPAPAPAPAPARAYLEVALEYARSAVEGRRVAGRLEVAACRRFLDDLVRARDGACPFRFDEVEVERVCTFAENLPHVEGQWEKGAGLLVLEPWQVWLLANVFGFRRRADGGRRFNTAYIEVARKNGKSALSAIVALYCLTMEGEVGPKVYCAATTGDQARIVFDVTKKMVERTALLREAFALEPYAHLVYCNANGGSLQPINAKASTQDGLNPHLAIIDELHAHKDRALFDVLRSARGARRNPLSWYITTAGYNLESVAFEQREIVGKILEGVFQADHYFGAIYTVDPDDDPFDERNWVKANPNLGVSVQVEELRQYAGEAQVSPDVAGEFKTKRLNVWLASSAAWLSIPAWDACADRSLSLEGLKGRPAWIAVDLASKDDLASIAVLSYEKASDTLFGLSRFYLPREAVFEDAQRKSHLVAWAEAGFLTLTDGNLIDYDRIEDDLRKIASDLDVRVIAFDPYQATQIVGRLSNDGLPATTVPVTVATMSDPSKDLEARIKAGKFRHDGNPILRWNASNVTVRRDLKGNIFPRKDRPNSPHKIDGIVAMILALGRFLADAQISERSVYHSRPLLVI